MRELRIPEGLEWEVLVVNNNCTDDTDSVIARHARHLPVHRVFEATPGHSNARNRAIAEAGGEFLIWTDDDVLVDPEWLCEYSKAFENWPEATFFGGTIDPWYEHAPPRWINRHIDKLRGVYAIRRLGSEVRPFVGTEYPFGANMAFRLSTLRTYPFDSDLGKVKSGTVAGDETDLFSRMQADGHKGVWVGTAKVRHYIPSARMTEGYVRAWLRGCGSLVARSEASAGSPIPGGIPRWMIRQYIQSTLLSWACSAVKSDFWFSEFYKAAFTQGHIDVAREHRQQARTGREASKPAMVPPSFNDRCTAG
jgi:hypothetical protein